MMDEVFANNSSDTVVVPPDFSVIIDNFTQEAKDLQDILDKQVEDNIQLETSKDYSNICNESTNNFVDITFTGNIGFSASFISQPWLVGQSPFKELYQSPLKASDLQLENHLPKAAHVSVITSVGNKGNIAKTNENVVNITFDNPTDRNPSQLRHTQSAVVNKTTNPEVRPRAHSDTCSQAMKNVSESTAQYVNLIEALNPEKTFTKSQPQFQKLQSFPTYMNVPFPTKCAGNMQKHPITNTKPESNSAPNTPRGKSTKRNISNSEIHSSYIQLWADSCVDKESLSDSECEEVKRLTSIPVSNKTRASGYVEMSSPYIRSPKILDSFADLATNLASYAGHIPRSIFCPFCPRYFSYEKSLSCHIQKTHYDELHKLSISPCEETFYQFCPICQARFFHTSILPKHLLDCHKSVVIRLLLNYECIKCNNSGIHCPFCNKKVPNNNTGDQVLLYHMQHVHADKLEHMMETKFKPYFSGCKKNLLKKKLSNNLVSRSSKSNKTATPGLSGKLCDLNVGKEIKVVDKGEIKNVNKPLNLKIKNADDKENVNNSNQTKTNASVQVVKQSISKGILRSEATVQRRPSAKRELRFSVPAVTSEEVYVPESPEQRSNKIHGSIESLTELPDNEGTMPIRIDSLGSADFIELTDQSSRKRRKLGIGLKSKNMFKKKDKENINIQDQYIVMGKGKNKENIKFVDHVVSGFGKIKPNQPRLIATSATRTFRKPKPVATPTIPTISLPLQNPKHNCCMAEKTTNHPISENDNPNITASCPMEEQDGIDGRPFSSMKLYSPMRMFRCNGCRVKFCDNEALSCHISAKHRGFLGILRPQFGCGVCSAKFYENKYLVKHCLQHHTSLLEIRSPKIQKISLYRINQN